MSNLTQEQIDALLGGAASPDEIGEIREPNGEVDISAYEQTETEQEENNPIDVQTHSMEQLEQELEKLDKSEEHLTNEEKDIIGEMGNICMGASATTMYTLLGRRVNITTPQVHVYTSNEVLSVYKMPFVVVNVSYTQGIKGKNLFILKESDTALITDLLMGGTGDIDYDNIELDDIHMSAMSEIMNQMIGASATSMSSLLGCAVDITPPTTTRVGQDMDVSELLDGSQLVIKVSFDMEIEGLLKSKLMLLIPIEAGKEMAQAVMTNTNSNHDQTTSDNQIESQKPNNDIKKKNIGDTAMQPGSFGNAPRGTVIQDEAAQPVKVQPFAYQPFDGEETASFENTAAPGMNPVIDLISDIPLQVAVELGKTRKSINEILEMGIGSVVVLDKMAGELVEIVVNGKHIARGEVVVIDENYGVRITDIDHVYY